MSNVTASEMPLICRRRVALALARENQIPARLKVYCARRYSVASSPVTATTNLGKTMRFVRSLALAFTGFHAASLANSGCAGLLEVAYGDGGGSGSNNGPSYDGGGGGGSLGALPAYARNDEGDSHEAVNDEDSSEELDDDFEDDDFDEVDDDIEEGDPAGHAVSSRTTTKPKSKDSFICESVLATNLPTGPGIPTKVSSIDLG